jgi:hypothetical protein
MQFSHEGDTYVDGGAIDNTPSNSAVDYVREWVEQKGLSKRDVNLELFVIYLGVEPKITQEEVQDPNLYQVVKRTLDIQDVAKQSSDANTVSTINTFGKRGEDLGRALQLVLESYRENMGSLSAEQQRQVESQLREKAQQSGQKGFLGKDAGGILERMQSWADDLVANGLPLHVEEVKIFPEEMPLGTLQFTERLWVTARIMLSRCSPWAVTTPCGHCGNTWTSSHRKIWMIVIAKFYPCWTSGSKAVRRPKGGRKNLANPGAAGGQRVYSIPNIVFTGLGGNPSYE